MPVIRPSNIILYLAFFLTIPLHGEVKVLKNFTLIDGTGRAPLPSAAMIVDNGKIQWVGPARQLKPPSSGEVIDLNGKFVMPGIINLHGHIGNTIDLTQDAKFFTRENIEKNLRTYASYGVTTVLSMGTDQDLIFQIRDEQRAGRPTFTRVYTAGQGFIYKGGYGGLAGVNEGIATVAEVQPTVAAQARKNVDIIKLWMDDHLGTFKKMPYDIADAIIDSAHGDRLRVAAHIFYLQDAQHLVDHGVDGLAHSVRDKPVDQKLIESMKRHGTWQIAATLSREASMFVYGQTPSFADDPFFTRSVSPKVVETLKSTTYQAKIRSDPEFSRYKAFLETAQKNLKTLADAGIQYGFGTDTGPPGRFPGYFEHWEMELMVEAGLSPMQVITAATRNSAELLHAQNLGILQATKWADFIVLDKNPLDDIKNTRTIRAVYIAGNKAN
ncbi:MAG: amidohydrolase family protein [Acidobacteriaceae bacterium]|nr:amidohydrolase family protein [Acidobacteriaceae bacterium]